MRARPGVVLLLALLGILALEFTAVGLHFAALQQLQVARSGARLLQLRLSAQSAAAAGARNWPVARALATPIGGSVPLPAAAGRADPHAITFGAEAERLTEELFLIRAQATSPLGERSQIGYLLLAPDPTKGLTGAAITTTTSLSLSAGAQVVASAPDCGPEEDPPAILLPDTSMLDRAPGTVIAGRTEVMPELRGSSLQELLPFSLSQLLDGAVTLTASRVQPLPVVLAGSCATAIATNWGEPNGAQAADPCSSWFPVLGRTGSLLVTGGRGQGILFVTGDLALSDGATFSGLVLVGGRLSLADGAAITGAVISVGDVTASAASVGGDRCAVRGALAAVPALVGPFRVSGRRWIPLL